ncbi:MAG: S41 family peptidase [Caldilineaceae bacterium]
MKQTSANLSLLLAVSGIWLLIGWQLHSWYSQSPQTAPVTPEAHLLEQARSLILQDYYLDSTIPLQQLSYAAIRGMIKQTGDPNAALFTPPISEYYAKDITGEVGVSGVVFDVIDQKLIILAVPPDRPAARAGIQVGDIVLGINGVMFDENTTKDEASLLFRGPVGTTAQVTVQRNQQILQYDIVRAEWPIFVAQRINNEIGYIGQRLFPLNAEIDMNEHLQSLLAQNVQALIWDLRDSRGGTMKATTAILSNFLAKGSSLYVAEFKNGERQTFFADESPKIIDLPLVVLIDENTYSSSEMAALALAENHRAILIGSQTEGKGTIQDTIALDDQHLLRITIAKWLSPSGQWVQHKGVTPDLEVVDNPKTDNDEVLDFAAQYIQQKWLAQVQ